MQQLEESTPGEGRGGGGRGARSGLLQQQQQQQSMVPDSMQRRGPLCEVEDTLVERKNGTAPTGLALAQFP